MSRAFDIVSYSVFVRGLARNALTEEVINLWDYVETQGLKWNTIMHNMVINGLSKSGKVMEAEAPLHMINLEE